MILLRQVGDKRLSFKNAKSGSQAVIISIRT